MVGEVIYSRGCYDCVGFLESPASHLVGWSVGFDMCYSYTTAYMKKQNQRFANSYIQTCLS